MTSGPSSLPLALLLLLAACPGDGETTDTTPQSSSQTATNTSGVTGTGLAWVVAGTAEDGAADGVPCSAPPQATRAVALATRSRSRFMKTTWFDLPDARYVPSWTCSVTSHFDQWA